MKEKMDRKLSKEQQQLFDSNIGLAYYLSGKYAKIYNHIERLIYDEIVQQSMLGLWNACKLYEEGKGEFKSYSAVAIRRSIKDYVRKVCKGFREVTNINIDPNRTPFRVIKHHEYDSDTLNRCISILTDDQKYAVCEYYLKGKVLKKIASQEKVTKQAISDRVQRGIANLRKWYL